MKESLAIFIYQIMIDLGYRPQDPNDMNIFEQDKGFIVRCFFSLKKDPLSFPHRYVLCFRIEDEFTYPQLRSVIEQRVLEALPY